jgi:hypothetical protein
VPLESGGKSGGVPDDELQEVDLFDASDWEVVSAWLHSGAHHIRDQASGFLQTVKSDLFEAGQELRECGKDALVLANAIPEGAATIKTAVKEDVHVAVAKVKEFGKSGWAALDAIDTMMQRALTDNREPRSEKPTAAPVLEWDVVLERDDKEKLGVALKWIEEETDLGPIVVTDIQPNALLHKWNSMQVDREQPAVRREGESMRPAVVRGLQVLTGDFLLSVNGLSLVGCGHEEKKRRLRSLRDQGTKKYTLGFARVLADGVVLHH